MRARFTALILVVVLSTACSTLLDASSDESIQSDRTQRSWGRMLDDEAIETKALVNIRKADERLRDSHIVVVSFNGIVLLTGQVADGHLSRVAEQTVLKIRYVRKVHNELNIAAAGEPQKYSNDSWITTKIRSKMLFSNKLDPAEVKVVTEAGTVYLMGLVNQGSADKAVEMARHTSGVEKVVRIFEYVE